MFIMFSLSGQCAGASSLHIAVESTCMNQYFVTAELYYIDTI